MRSTEWKVHKIILSVLVPMVFFGFSAHAADSWAEHSGHLVALAKQIESIENDIHATIEEKHKTEDAKQLKEMIDTIAAKHKSLTGVAKDYEEELNLVRFKFPERAEKLDRKYVHYHVKSIQEMEKETGLDGRLDHAKARVLATFPIPKEPDKPKVADDNTLPKALKERLRHPASQEVSEDISPDDEIPSKLHLEK